MYNKLYINKKTDFELYYCFSDAFPQPLISNNKIIKIVFTLFIPVCLEILVGKILTLFSKCKKINLNIISNKNNTKKYKQTKIDFDKFVFKIQNRKGWRNAVFRNFKISPKKLFMF